MKTQQLHQVLNAVWAVVADANRYFAGEAPWALAKTDPARQGTVLYVTAEVLRQVAILCQPFMPASAASCSTCSAVPASERAISPRSAARQRIAPGATLPAPAPVFPRYVEPETQRAQGVTPCWSTAIAISIFPISPTSSTPWSARAKAAGIGRMVTISTRVRRHARAAGDRRALSGRVLLGRHPSAQRA